MPPLKRNSVEYTIDGVYRGPSVWEGDLFIDLTEEVDFSRLRQVTGGLWITGSANLNFPKLQYVNQNLRILRWAGEVSLPALEGCSGSIVIVGARVRELPSLTDVGGCLDASLSALTALPKIKNVHGAVYLDGTEVKELPELGLVYGSLNVRNSSMSSAPKLRYVGGQLVPSASVVFTAPLLLTLGLSLRLGSARHIPRLASLKKLNTLFYGEKLYELSEEESSIIINTPQANYATLTGHHSPLIKTISLDYISSFIESNKEPK